MISGGQKEQLARGSEMITGVMHEGKRAISQGAETRALIEETALNSRSFAAQLVMLEAELSLSLFSRRTETPYNEMFKDAWEIYVQRINPHIIFPIIGGRNGGYGLGSNPSVYDMVNDEGLYRVSAHPVHFTANHYAFKESKDLDPKRSLTAEEFMIDLAKHIDRTAREGLEGVKDNEVKGQSRQLVLAKSMAGSFLEILGRKGEK